MKFLITKSNWKSSVDGEDEAGVIEESGCDSGKWEEEGVAGVVGEVAVVEDKAEWEAVEEEKV